MNLEAGFLLLFFSENITDNIFLGLYLSVILQISEQEMILKTQTLFHNERNKARSIQTFAR